MSLFSNLDKTTNRGLSETLTNLKNQFIPARVLEVDQSTTLTNGVIVVEELNTSSNLGLKSKFKAWPFFPNIKIYPLKNEVVFLFSAPHGDLSTNPGNIKYYYLTSLNIWNNPQVNPTPNQYENISPDTQNKSLAEIEAGSSNKSSVQGKENFKPGTYFNEKDNIYPLYPYEGDTILEGRFGNSIRLGNTVFNSLQNSWSSFGNIGDPILIIRNGQDVNLKGPVENLIVEDINKEQSSIWLTSTQKVPINIASTNDYLSYSQNKPTHPKEYNKKQIILSSGRLIFNTTEDHLLLSSIKTINLNATEGITFDTTKDVVIQSNRVFLGGIDTAQPIILGDELINLLTDVLSDLDNLTRSLETQVSTPPGTPLAPTNLIAKTIGVKIPGYKQRLKNSLSKTTKTV